LLVNDGNRSREPFEVFDLLFATRDAPVSEPHCTTHNCGNRDQKNEGNQEFEEGEARPPESFT
jgi:hypothetical protein